ncbi:DUF7448 domain-containing protein [Listeria booriae]|uniref:DUF7448 domain-containing protein n=1 Tax=Listeria booriae TaxID=1552123 RepID=UPI001624DC12|nr:hypothetical protein [Listeria booriae]MBC2386401.1 hypothetical protein [Listeria booriae]
MYDVKYGTFDNLREKLLYKRITAWTKDKLTLEDGTEITIECSEQDCCAGAGGEFTDVELDAVITEVSDPHSVRKDTTSWGETTAYGTVTIFHNNNPVATANCNADDGNCGYYYSVCSLVINDVHYEVVSA